MRRLIVLIALAASGALTMIIAQAQPDPTAIRIEKVNDALYIVTGGRGHEEGTSVSGNTTVFITSTGVVLVDTKYPGYGKAILDQVKTVTAKPVTMIINTHTHVDHTAGNRELPRNVDIVAHENTRSNMQKMDEFKGENAAVLPKKTFKDKLTLLSGKDRIDLYHFGPGHTNGDAVIVFPALRTAVMGDLFARKWAPLVDANNGGSAVAYPQTLANAVAGIKDVDTVITGHATTSIGSGQDRTYVRSNPIMKWTDLQEYAGFTRDLVTAAQTAMKSGKTVDQAVAGLKLPDRYKDYNTANLKADVQLIYDESK
jgi:glyoxylase-like metal-dependent hydrolase (beta-lactamase superfamily II)